MKISLLKELMALGLFNVRARAFCPCDKVTHQFHCNITLRAKKVKQAENKHSFKETGFRPSSSPNMPISNPAPGCQRRGFSLLLWDFLFLLSLFFGQGFYFECTRRFFAIMLNDNGVRSCPQIKFAIVARLQFFSF